MPSSTNKIRNPDQVPMLLLYDGHCLLCNGFVKRLLSKDRSGELKVAALQDYANVNKGTPIDSNVDSVVLIINERVFYKSDAVLKVKATQSSEWWYNLLMVIPKFIRNAVYDLVASNRYRWFGRSDTCVLPSPSLRQKYLIGEKEIEEYLLKPANK